MPYGLIYRLTFNAVVDNDTGATEECVLDICKTSTFDPGATTTYVTLTGSVPPVRISVIDNDRNKLTSIRAKVAEINLDPSEDYNAETFAVGPDNEWKVFVNVVSTGYNLFIGFLVMDDFQKAFLPVSHHVPFRLTATDQLGNLKEIELTDFDGERIFDTPSTKHSYLQYLLWALHKTGLDLNVVICSTWFEESQTAFECALENIYVSHKAFEADINKKVDCYTAIQMLLEPFLCSLFQRGGKWWVRSIDEPTSGPLYGFEYDTTGSFIQQITSTDYTQTIGRSEDVKFIGKDAIVNYSRPAKTGRVTLNYTFPREILDNIDLSRGTDDLLIIPVDMGTYIRSVTNFSDLPATGEAYQVYRVSSTNTYYKWVGLSYDAISGGEIPVGIAYVWEDWTIERVGGGSPNATGYIAKIFENVSDEKARYGVITTSANGHRMVSNPIPVNKYDKFTFSADRRLNVNLSGSGVVTDFAFQAKVTGYDGSAWTLQSDGTWQTTNQVVAVQWNRGQTDEKEWMNCSADSNPIPVAGTLTIALYQTQFTSTAQTHYANLQFEYVPFINGSYQRYKGHQNEVTQSGDYKPVIEIETKFGDSPVSMFKETLFKLDGAGNYIRTGRWYAAGDLLNQGITPPIPNDYLHPLGFLQAYALWNQYNRRMVTISGSLRGLRLDTSFIPDLLENYDINAAGVEEADNKKYALLSMGQDPDSGEWSGTISESFDTAIGKDYLSPHTFKYKGGEI